MRLGRDAVERVAGDDRALDHDDARDDGAAEDRVGPELVVALLHPVIALAGDRAVDDRLGEQRRRDPDHVADRDGAAEGGDHDHDHPEEIVAVEIEPASAALPSSAAAGLRRRIPRARPAAAAGAPAAATEAAAAAPA